MMAERDALALRFEEHRPHLRAVAYRMLGSLSEADDAVQDAWLRLSRVDARQIENLGAWLRQVVSRVCLDMLRSRKARREDSLDAPGLPPPPARGVGADPEQEALMADDVGLALLVVMDRLEPAERLAFVLYDLFAVPFDEIAPIVGRTPAAARQLASRARRRVRGVAPGQGDTVVDTQPALARREDIHQQRAVIDAFLAAARSGDLHGLLAVLDPDVVFRTATPAGPQAVHGAEAVAPLAMRGRAVAARPLLVNGAVGVVVAPRGRLLMILDFTIRDGRVVAIEAVAEPRQVATLELAVLD
ncbi:MAG: sigma-70 family RNA polymerase sigma factor [Thermomicrobiales bacterium]|nr:sigma-70 family RNA polymerase sigma factor [Thermomicrobiales bacterium]